MFQRLKRFNWDWLYVVVILAFIFIGAYDFAKFSRANLEMKIEGEMQAQMKMRMLNAIKEELERQEQNASREGN